jgi:hypothetical protein
MKARVQKFDDDAQQAVTQAAGGVATTGETLNLENRKPYNCD